MNNYTSFKKRQTANSTSNIILNPLENAGNAAANAIAYTAIGTATNAINTGISAVNTTAQNAIKCVTPPSSSAAFPSASPSLSAQISRSGSINNRAAMMNMNYVLFITIMMILIARYLKYN